MGATEDIPLARARPWPLVPIMMVLAGAFVSRGFPAPPPSSSGLSERATVELVLIEVYVTDGRGRPIRDLTTDDFALMVDGHAKPIHSLEFQSRSSLARSQVISISIRLMSIRFQVKSASVTRVVRRKRRSTPTRASRTRKVDLSTPQRDTKSWRTLMGS